MNKKWKRRWLALALLLVLGELVARYVIGLGELPVYVKHASYEYVYAPNQEVTRFGNRIITNQHSMRNRELASKKGIRILKVGDSVLNGGSYVDHDSLSSTRLEVQLTAELKEQVEVLNVSAQSWGPDNGMAYLEAHGGFDTDFLILVFSSHDLHDNRHYQPVVGEHAAWPDEQPWLATTEVFSRYLVPRIQRLVGIEPYEDIYLRGIDDSKINSGWADLVAFARKQQIPVVLYLHPDQAEWKAGQYNKQGQKILQMMQNLDVPTVQGLDAAYEATDYRDGIHLNAGGHRKIAAALKQLLIDNFGAH